MKGKGVFLADRHELGLLHGMFEAENVAWPSGWPSPEGEASGALVSTGSDLVPRGSGTQLDEVMLQLARGMLQNQQCQQQNRVSLQKQQQDHEQAMLRLQIDLQAQQQQNLQLQLQLQARHNPHNS